MLKDIQSREDIMLLMSKFYTQVRTHETLGPIFNPIIQNWDEHLEHIGDFWEGMIFQKAIFKGNPMKAHIEADKYHNHSITQLHFHEWLTLWHSTVDSLFEGENAELVKNRARNIASHLNIKITMAKPS